MVEYIHFSIFLLWNIYYKLCLIISLLRDIYIYMYMELLFWLQPSDGIIFNSKILESFLSLCTMIICLNCFLEKESSLWHEKSRTFINTLRIKLFGQIWALAHINWVASIALSTSIFFCILIFISMNMKDNRHYLPPTRLICLYFSH